MSYKNYKEGTGVRARSDLTANTLPAPSDRLTNEDVVKAAQYIIQQCEASAQRGDTLFRCRIPVMLKIADAMLEAVNRAHP
jgi:hypothetical protein